jgi:DNA polymerase-3 subunit epsilon
MRIRNLFGRQSKRSAEPAFVSAQDRAMVDVSAPTTRYGEQATGFAVVDIETTGLSPKTHRIVQVAVVTTSPSGEVVGKWSTLINPDGPMGASHIHGLTDNDVRSAPKFAVIADEIRERLEGLAIVAHNLRFDSSFLAAEYRRLGWEIPDVPAVCTYLESVHFLPELSSRKLSDCCLAIGVEPGGHDALSDAFAASALMAHYLDIARREGVRSELLLYPDTAAGVAWPKGPTVTPEFNMEAQRHKRIQLSMARPRKTSGTLLYSLGKVNLDGLLWDEAPEGSLEFLALVRTAIEDGVITEDEASQLTDLAEAFQLTSETTARLKERLLSFLAAQTWSDGVLSMDERNELKTLARALGLTDKAATKSLKLAEADRLAGLSQGLLPLPDDWRLGEPLRVGHRIAFTGCDWELRERLEVRSIALGCRLTGSVSGKTDILVTDGSYVGNKREAAERHGTRIVHPNDFELMLAHIQPQSDSGGRASSGASAR